MVCSGVNRLGHGGWFDGAWPDGDWPGLAWTELVWFVSVRFGQVWFGLVGSDLGGFGVTRPSPARYSAVQSAFGRPAGMRIRDLGHGFCAGGMSGRA